MLFLQNKPYFLNSCEGTNLKMSDALVCVKASSEQTGGLFNLFEIDCPAGFNTPMHIHYVEDVTVFVLAGELTVFWGEERRRAAVGAYVFLPRGTPNGFLVESDKTARILCATIPAGFDQFLYASTAGKNNSSANAARHKIEILGPLPE